jgi:hypothetical protein
MKGRMKPESMVLRLSIALRALLILLPAIAVATRLISQSRSPVFNRYACIFGLLGQPFWMYTTYSSAQWGMFGITFVYTWAWWGLRGTG